MHACMYVCMCRYDHRSIRRARSVIRHNVLILLLFQQLQMPRVKTRRGRAPQASIEHRRMYVYVHMHMRQNASLIQHGHVTRDTWHGHETLARNLRLCCVSSRLQHVPVYAAFPLHPLIPNKYAYCIYVPRVRHKPGAGWWVLFLVMSVCMHVCACTHVVLLCSRICTIVYYWWFREICTYLEMSLDKCMVVQYVSFRPWISLCSFTNFIRAICIWELSFQWILIAWKADASNSDKLSCAAWRKTTTKMCFFWVNMKALLGKTCSLLPKQDWSGHKCGKAPDGSWSRSRSRLWSIYFNNEYHSQSLTLWAFHVPRNQWQEDMFSEMFHLEYEQFHSAKTEESLDNLRRIKFNWITTWEE